MGKRKTFLIPHEELNLRPSDSALTLVSVSIGARNPKVWGSITHGESDFFSLSQASDKAKNIFLYFFTELKTYHLSNSTSFLFAKYAQF